MRVQCSIQGSTLGGEKVPNGLAPALTESPLKALQGNQDLPAFYGVQATASSAAPALIKYLCNPAGDDPLQNALDTFEYCTSHTWSAALDDGTIFYTQRDELDPNTLDPTAADILFNNDPSFINPPWWNNQISYLDPPHSGGANIISAAGDAWDKTATRNAIVAALNGVDWASLWNSVKTPRVFLFDRSGLSSASQGPLPLGGSHTGNIFSVDEPNQRPTFLGRGGVLIAPIAIGYASSANLLLQRSQIQVRNMAGGGMEYIIVEQISTTSGASGDGTQFGPTKGPLADLRDFWRLAGTGIWEFDGQIIQLPDPPFDAQIINTPLGQRVRFGTLSYMVVGITFEQYMFSLWGSDWQQHVVS